MSLSDKLTIENFRDDDWFNENIWDDDLDKNEIVELVLKEVSKDVKEAVKKLKDFLEDRKGRTDMKLWNEVIIEINEIFGEELIK